MESIKKLLILIFATIVLVGFSGCLEKPEIEVVGHKIQKLNADNTKIDIVVLVENPNPIGVNLDEVSFDIYALVNGDKIYLGHGEQRDIKITSGNNTFTIPVTLSNKKLVEAVVKSKSTKVPVQIIGNVTVNLIVTKINVAIDIQKEIDVSEIVKDEIKQKLYL
ncbi:LEA type 2 family protein [Methanocaldococcus fervens]|uniref:Late embryogenesis abundant protein LEA-2 subgroup domain-containing protein n=1 Tax=Methanocaldococcus fervens (strain DSM 4213 / JCM 15782 / AG86) TaxID=573064 RepID=C7P763_METFA|nr:LEA type 2 family protein [Methanocaldococcus fervens]ACV24395.1 hypothetical protein Mefer_0574 [Methanocaldococcus fervens AG86]